MLHTKNFFSNLFLLSEHNMYSYNRNIAAKLWSTSIAIDEALKNLQTKQTSISHIYGDMPLYNPNMGPFEINLSDTYYLPSGDRLNELALKEVLRTNAKTFRFESRKKTLLSYILPVYNVLTAPLRFPVALALDLLVNLPIDLALGAVRLASDRYDSYNNPRVEVEQDLENGMGLSNNAQSSYVCKNPITTCFNRAKQCLGYNLNSTEKSSSYKPAPHNEGSPTTLKMTRD